MSRKWRPKYDPYAHWAAGAPGASQATTRRRHLVWLAGGGVVAVAGAGVIFALAQGGQGGPAMEVNLDADTVTVDKPLIDLGHVALGKAVPVSVWLVNQSRRVVALGRPMAEALEGC